MHVVSDTRVEEDADVGMVSSESVQIGLRYCNWRISQRCSNSRSAVLNILYIRLPKYRVFSRKMEYYLRWEMKMTSIERTIIFA